MSASQIQHPVGGVLASAISNGVVRLLREYTGRGPTRARTHISDDLINVVLEDTLTKGEQSLVNDGETALVLSARNAYQRTMRTDLVILVEELTGRKVRACRSLRRRRRATGSTRSARRRSPARGGSGPLRESTLAQVLPDGFRPTTLWMRVTEHRGLPSVRYPSPVRPPPTSNGG